MIPKTDLDIGIETAIQQAYASETAALNEMVLFEFVDSSGMSYRTTDKVGAAAATGDGGEGSPIEIDPLGGSVGMFTPYLTLSGGDYEPTYPDVTRVYNRSDDNNYQPDFDFLYATFGSRTADLPGFGTNWGSFAELGERLYSERVQNSRDGFGFITNEEFIAQAYAQAAEQDRAVGEPGEGSDSDSGPATSEESADFAQDAGDSSTLVDTHLAGLYDSSVTVSAGGDFGFENMTSENLESFRVAVEATRKILSNNNSCSNLFKGAGLNALNAISLSVEQRGEVAFSNLGPGLGATGIQMTIPTQVNKDGFTAPETDSNGNPIYGFVAPIAVTINTGGAFIRRIAQSELSGDRLPNFGGFEPASIQSRALQLLHEIGHLTVIGTELVERVITVGKGKQKEKRRYQQFSLDLLLKLDDGNPSLSEKNTKEVFKACEDQLKAIVP